MKSIYKISKLAGLLTFIFQTSLTSCKKLVEVNPPVTSTTGQSVFSDDATAIAALTGIYGSLSQASFNSSAALTGLSKFGGLSSDELSLWSGAGTTDMAYYTNSLAAPFGTGVVAGHEIWNICYPNIYRCNEVIERISNTQLLTSPVKKQLLGEAKFMRAFLYFYLVNLYGDVPLALQTDYKVNGLLARASKQKVYEQIISDLKDAQDLLSPIYLNGQLKPYTGISERIRPASWTATALLARVYLFTGDNIDAEKLASLIIDNSSTFSLSTLANVFLRSGLGNNKEAIWQLQPVNTNGATNNQTNYWNTEDGRFFVLTAAPAGVNGSHPVYLSASLLSAFEAGDARAVVGNWINKLVVGPATYYYPYKYKIGDPVNATAPSEYCTVFRLAEQYLIRAEARAQQNNISGALSDLNLIRARANLPGYTTTDQSQLLNAILHERQVELFTEWGHRWLDLKRTGKVDFVMNIVTPLKSNGDSWKTYQQWYPIPISDIQRNPNLIQNSGY
jgi:hypothetical protein